MYNLYYLLKLILASNLNSHQSNQKLLRTSPLSQLTAFFKKDHTISKAHIAKSQRETVRPFLELKMTKTKIRIMASSLFRRWRRLLLTVMVFNTINDNIFCVYFLLKPFNSVQGHAWPRLNPFKDLEDYGKAKLPQRSPFQTQRTRLN